MSEQSKEELLEYIKDQAMEIEELKDKLNTIEDAVVDLWHMF